MVSQAHVEENVESFQWKGNVAKESPAVCKSVASLWSIIVFWYRGLWANNTYKFESIAHLVSQDAEVGILMTRSYISPLAKCSISQKYVCYECDIR